MSNDNVRLKPIPDEKVELVSEVADKIKNVKTVLIASCRGLPSSQFQNIKKKLRGKAEIKFMKKNAFERAIDATEKGALKNLKKELEADFAIFFSDIDTFELSALLTDSQVPTKARSGDISPENIEIEPGPTDLPPGPAISELGSVGLKVSVKEGKLEIIKGAVVAREGEPISEKVAGVLAKLGIFPMKSGFIPLAAYDSKDDKVYVGIKIDKEGTLNEFRSLIGKALGFAVGRNYPTTETISFLISRAAMEEKAIGRIVNEPSKPVQTEETNTETQKEETPQTDTTEIQQDTKEENN